METPPRPAPIVTEPVPIFETFVTGIAAAEDCGDFFRVSFYVDRPLVGTHESERAIVARLIVPSALYGSIVDALAVAKSNNPSLAVAS
ncbi:MAG: hypothetical protein ACTSWI_06330 [Alphaproteobacteria bacterium]